MAPEDDIANKTDRISEQSAKDKNDFNNIINALINALNNLIIHNGEKTNDEFEKSFEYVNKESKNYSKKIDELVSDPERRKTIDAMNIVLEKEVNSFLGNKYFKDLDPEKKIILLGKLKAKDGICEELDLPGVESIHAELTTEKRFKEIQKELDDMMDPLQKKVEEYGKSLQNLSQIEIKGANNSEKLNNFINQINPYLIKAKEIEGENQDSKLSFKLFKKLTNELISLNSSALKNDKLKKKLERKKKQADQAFDMFDLFLEKSLREAKSSLLKNEKFKGETDLIFYLYDKLEDIFKTPTLTHNLLSKSEEEIKSMSLQEAKKKQAELDEITIQFEKIINYLKSNIQVLKNPNTLNQAIILGFLKKAFDGLKGIDVYELEQKIIKSTNILHQGIMNIINTVINNSLILKKEDAPHYKKSLNFLQNIIKIYDNIIMFNLQEAGINDNNYPILQQFKEQKLREKSLEVKEYENRIKEKINQRNEVINKNLIDLNNFYKSLSEFNDLILALNNLSVLTEVEKLIVNDPKNTFSGSEVYNKLNEIYNKLRKEEKEQEESIDKTSTYQDLANFDISGEKFESQAQKLEKIENAKGKDLETQLKNFNSKTDKIISMVTNILLELDQAKNLGKNLKPNIIIKIVENYNELIRLLKTGFDKETDDIVTSYKNLFETHKNQIDASYVFYYEENGILTETKLLTIIKEIEKKLLELTNNNINIFKGTLKLLKESDANINQIYKSKIIQGLASDTFSTSISRMKNFGGGIV